MIASEFMKGLSAVIQGALKTTRPRIGAGKRSMYSWWRSIQKGQHKDYGQPRATTKAPTIVTRQQLRYRERQQAKRYLTALKRAALKQKKVLHADWRLALVHLRRAQQAQESPKGV